MSDEIEKRWAEEEEKQEEEKKKAKATGVSAAVEWVEILKYIWVIIVYPWLKDYLWGHISRGFRDDFFEPQQAVLTIKDEHFRWPTRENRSPFFKLNSGIYEATYSWKLS